MKKSMIAVVALVIAVSASSAMAWGYGHSHGRPVVVHSGYGRVMIAPRPVYYAPRPVVFVRPMPVYRSWFSPAPIVYTQPVVLAQPRVVVQTQPIYTSAPQPVVQTLQIPQGFVESGRRLHTSGSDAGTVDWMKGTLDGRRVKIEFNTDGSRHGIEPD